MPASVLNSYAQNHRRQQWMTLAVAGLLLGAATIPRNERAMFVIYAPAGEAPKVFAAIIPPLGYLPVDPFDQGSTLRRIIGETPFRPSGPGTTPDSSAFTPVPPGSPVDDAPPSDGILPFQGTPALLPASTMGAPSGPIFGGSSPAAPAPPVDGVGPILPVAPVPEPGTWAMMIAGFSIVGLLLRRRRRGSAGVAEGQHAVSYR